MDAKIIQLTVNGRAHKAIVEPNLTLLHVLRETLGYLDVKNGCEKGDCGACTVLLDGKPVNSCLVLAWQADGCTVTTDAGLGTLDHPHPIQAAFADLGAAQCGYCTPGMVLATKALLDENPHPTDTEIRIALSGNLCRCTGYGQILRAVHEAEERLSK
jgi:aerobic-type carbon monoxide dehydrogenase small subunit (CoxS/CutS family)